MYENKEQLLKALELIKLIATAKCNLCKDTCTHEVFFQDIAAIVSDAQKILENVQQTS